jgi:signal transduction histidine kinase
VPDRKLHLELKSLPPLWGDRAMIRLLLKNLLSNAIKFTRPRPQAIIEVGGSSEGSGTGVAMVKRIVGRHGGRVWAEGQVDVGATIHFTVPAKEEGNDTG